MGNNRNFWDLEEIRTEIFSGEISKAWHIWLSH